ncbi:MAG TPA: flavin reductase family protein, partial [Armatimonadota bacterium]|nr:flavin reductase family protein [Armatimonadota bacterium]
VTFKSILSRWASGVTVVTCRREPEGIHGMTASAFTSVSLEPPLVLICVDRRHKTHRYIQRQGAFGIHVLGAGMDDISDRCAGFFGEQGHWLEGEPWRAGVTGAPLLERNLAWMECSLWQAYDGGDHTIFVGKVEAGGAADGRPLLWFERGYRALPDLE